MSALHEEYERRAIQISTTKENGISYVSHVHVAKVGRPCNKDKAKPIAILGKCSKPSQLENTHEITLANNLVRDLITFKNMCIAFEIRNLTFQFREDGLHIIEAVNENEMTTAYLSVFFNAHYVHYYYCRSPMNVRISTNALIAMLESAKNETHYIKICVCDGTVEGFPNMRTYVHLRSPSIDLNISIQRETTIIDDDDPTLLPQFVNEYYPFEFFIQSAAILSMLLTKDMSGLRLTNSSTSVLQIMPMGANEKKEINIGNALSNIVRNTLHPSETFSINLPRDILKKFVNIGETSGTHKLHFCIHPTEVTFLTFKCFNARINDQFDVSKEHIEQYIHSCTISLILPRMRIVNGRHNIISQGII